MSQSGWFADPTGRHRFRFWDGAVWTAHVSDGASTGTDSIATVAQSRLSAAPAAGAAPAAAPDQAPAAGRSSRRRWLLGLGIPLGVLALAGAVGGVILLIQLVMFGAGIGSWFGGIREDNAEASDRAQLLAEAVDADLEDARIVSYYGGGATPTQREWIHIEVVVGPDADLASVLAEMGKIAELEEPTGTTTQLVVRRPGAGGAWSVISLGQGEGGLAASATKASAVIAEAQRFDADEVSLHLNDPQHQDSLDLLFGADPSALAEVWQALGTCAEGDVSCPSIARLPWIGVVSSVQEFSYSAAVAQGEAPAPYPLTVVEGVLEEFDAVETYLRSDETGAIDGGVCVPADLGASASDAMEQRADALAENTPGLSGFGVYGCQDTIAERFGPADATGLTEVG